MSTVTTGSTGSATGYIRQRTDNYLNRRTKNLYNLIIKSQTRHCVHIFCFATYVLLPFMTVHPITSIYVRRAYRTQTKCRLKAYIKYQLYVKFSLPHGSLLLCSQLLNAYFFCIPNRQSNSWANSTHVLSKRGEQKQKVISSHNTFSALNEPTVNIKLVRGKFYALKMLAWKIYVV